MKVLLLGEFSGFYKYLKAGLEANDVEVDWYASGDGYKKITGMDGDLLGHSGNKFYDKIIFPIQLVTRLKTYDVIQLVHPLIFSPWINKFLVKILKRKCKILVISADGTDYYVYKYRDNPNKEFGYSLLDGCNDYDVFYAKKSRYSRNDIEVIKMCDALIPGIYDYEVAHRDIEKTCSVIRFPIDVDTVSYSENVVSEKVIFFHGLNRESFKGTSYIRYAMEKLKEKYPDEVEVIIDGRMPFDKYMKIMKKSNVILDQCKSYGPGINALLAMAQGKIVLSGAENLSIEGMQQKDYPIFNIIPDSEQIFNVMEYILKNRDQICRWGFDSRKFVEKYYNYVENAKLYKETWEMLITKKNKEN